MFHSKPYKKDITPFAKGGKVVKHVGKGAREQSTLGGRSTLTGGDPYARMTNNYPKPPPQDFSAPTPQPAPPVPTGSQPPSAPTAMMPGGIGEEEE
jgi:hypothetical protein